MAIDAFAQGPQS